MPIAKVCLILLRLQNSLHIELKNETIPVMEAWLDFLIKEANYQPIVKIKPKCPFKSYWLRNRADNPGFKAWRELYDETYSSGKGKNKTKEVSQNTSGLGAIPKTGTDNVQNHPQIKVTQNQTSKNSGDNIVDPKVHAEFDMDAPVAVNIKPTKVLGSAMRFTKWDLKPLTSKGEICLITAQKTF